jgi:hypothetical protein
MVLAIVEKEKVHEAAEAEASPDGHDSGDAAEDDDGEADGGGGGGGGAASATARKVLVGMGAVSSNNSGRAKRRANKKARSRQVRRFFMDCLDCQQVPFVVAQRCAGMYVAVCVASSVRFA